MNTMVLAAKIVLAATLIMAGSAKLGTQEAFAETIRRFTHPFWRQAPTPRIALGVAATEILLGAVSLLIPSRRPVDVLVALFCGGLLATAAVGYRLHRGKPCHCFGGLGRGTFGKGTIARTAAMAAAAFWVVLAPAPQTAGLDITSLGLLLTTLALVSFAAGQAARILEQGQGAK